MARYCSMPSSQIPGVQGMRMNEFEIFPPQPQPNFHDFPRPPIPPHFFCFSPTATSYITTSTKFVLFSFSTTTFILFSHHCHHHHLISIVFPRYYYHHHYIYFVCSTLPPPLSHFIVIPPPRLFIVGWCWVVWEVDVGSIICNGQGENNKNVVVVVIRKNRNVDMLVEEGNQKLSK